MTDMIIHTLSCVKHKKVQRQRGTGKRRSVFVFRRANTVKLTNVTPSFTQLSTSIVGDGESTIESNVTFSYDVFDQCVSRLHRSERIPVVVRYYQGSDVQSSISAREAAMIDHLIISPDKFVSSIGAEHNVPASGGPTFDMTPAQVSPAFGVVNLWGAELLKNKSIASVDSL